MPFFHSNPTIDPLTPFLPAHQLCICFFLALQQHQHIQTQLPLSLSWAATIHKMQGFTLSNAVIDIGNDVFGPGMSMLHLAG
jgi:hypothetical protein